MEELEDEKRRGRAKQNKSVIERRERAVNSENRGEEKIRNVKR